MLAVVFTAGEQMKEQYLGDVSDYRKYALLRALTAKTGLSLGVCWMLTPDDGRNDGNKLDYLNEPDIWRPHDPPVFDLLTRVVAQPESRRLQVIAQSGLLGQALLFGWELSDEHTARHNYMAEAKRRLGECDVVFFDPDNGLGVPSVRKGRKNSSKYLYLDEAAVFWAGGASLLIYQHYPRFKRSIFEAEVRLMVSAVTPGAHVTLFHTPDVLFVLAAQSRHLPHVKQATDRIPTMWPGWFIKTSPSASHHGEPPQSAVTSVITVTTYRAPHDDACEARVPGGTWSRIGIDEAIDRRGAIEMRCSECHGRVRAHRAASDKSFRAHFEHAQRHAGCSRSPRYSGVQTRHPAAVD